MTEMTRSRRSVTSLILRVLDFVDRAGNRLPHPFWLFVILSVLVVAASWLLAGLGVSVVSPATGKEIAVKSLVSDAGLRTQMAAAARRTIQERYSLDVTAPRVAGVMRHVVERGRRAAAALAPAAGDRHP